MAKTTKFNGLDFSVGDTIKVSQRIQEEGKFRTQPFQGIVIAIKGKSPNKMFTVRRIAAGAIGVERTFPLLSPWIEKIERVKARHVKRAKLYYLRKRQGEVAVRTKNAPLISEKSKTRPARRKTSRKVSPKK